VRIAAFGTGGVGGYFGGRLAQASEDVTFIARGEHLQAIREHGLRVKSIKGDFSMQPAQATDDPAQTGGGPSQGIRLPGCSTAGWNHVAAT
jgi:2-dehydropantoate 2-reductase